MALEKLVSEARRWAGESALGFTVSGVEEGTRKISFRAPCGSFYVTVPENVGSEEWVRAVTQSRKPDYADRFQYIHVLKGVWSEEENCISQLSLDMDYLSSPQRTFTDVLERAASCVVKASSKEEEEEEEERMSNSDNASDDDFDAYYGVDEDPDMEMEVCEKESPIDQNISADDFFTGQGSSAAVHRLLADLKNLKKSSGKYGISGSPRGDNLFVWDVELSDFEKSSKLYKDLEAYAKRLKRKPVVEMEMKFPKDYPMSPPFVRIVRPRFQFLTGHVTVGGSICMQMLTRSGWSPSNDIESILIQVRAEIMSDSNAQLDATPERDYDEQEATAAFERMVRRYGWER